MKGDVILDKVLEAARLIKESESVVVITGAGASTESGIPDFRSNIVQPKNRKKYDYPSEVLLSHSFFISNTETFYDYYMNNLIYRDAKPNDCHKSLAEMEKYCNVLAVITQNIDGLHQEAGSSNVIELHGTTRRYFCMKCRKQFSLDDFKENQHVPKCDKCGGIIKPDVVLYEEPLNDRYLTMAANLAMKADVLLVIGTSLVVYPAAGLLNYYRGNKLLIVNLGTTPFDSRARIVIHESCGSVMKRILDGLTS